MIGETGERKSAVATPDGKSRKKKKQEHRYVGRLLLCVCNLVQTDSPVTYLRKGGWDRVKSSLRASITPPPCSFLSLRYAM